MILFPTTTLDTNRFVRRIAITPVEDGCLQAFADCKLIQAAQACAERGMPLLATQNADKDPEAAICIPMFRNREVQSVVTIVVRESTHLEPATGVFEVWCPVGPYRELSLASGYFGRLERFQNVSSFVRFEKGSGLPGQAWATGHPVIHDNLRNHPAFLRAAGASAESLQTAIGIPIFANDFVASVVFISSKATPIARGFEVWKPLEHDRFELIDSAFAQDDEPLRLPVGFQLEADTGLVGLAHAQNSAALSECPSIVCEGRDSISDSQPFSAGLALPTYHGEQLASITTLLF